MAKVRSGTKYYGVKSSDWESVVCLPRENCIVFAGYGNKIEVDAEEQ